MNYDKLTKRQILLKIIMLCRAKEELYGSLAAVQAASPIEGKFNLDSYIRNAISQCEWCLERMREAYRRKSIDERQVREMTNTDEKIVEETSRS